MEILCDGDFRLSWLPPGLSGGDELISGTSSTGEVSLPAPPQGGVMLGGGDTELPPDMVMSLVERIIATGLAMGGSGGGGSIVEGKYWLFGLREMLPWTWNTQRIN